MTTSKNRLIEIDILKTLAIMLIVLAHIPPYINDVFEELAPYPTLFGLSLFVFISGYTLNDQIGTKKELIKYAKKRITRIVPLYLIALILFVLPSYNNINSITLLSHIFCAQVLLAPRIVIPVATLWYIGLIMLYYFLYPFLLKYSQTSKDLIVNSLIILFAFIILRSILGIVEIRFFAYYFVFIAGIIARKKELFNLKFQKYFLISFLIFIISMLSYIYLGSSSINESLLHEKNIYQMILILLLANMIMLTYVQLMFWIAQYYLSNISKLNSFYSKCALASYCIYLFHRPFFVFMKLIFTNSAKVPSTYSNILLIFVGLPTLFFICYYIQIYENRFLKRIME